MKLKRGTCSICFYQRFLFYDTPNDPPFYPARDGEHHCLRCESWLRTGRSWNWIGFLRVWWQRRDERYLEWRSRWR